MKAMFLNTKAGPESLIWGELPMPQPKAGEVLVQVHATTVMPTELQWIPTFTTRSGAARPFPVVLSHEFSGVIASVGAGAGHFKEGDAVYGLNDWFANGAQAEYCIAPASAIALKPQSLDHVSAAVVPISALTAWQALTIRSRLRSGQRVLIHGASGGVGTFAVQIARSAGAHVIATASAAQHDLLRTLGADEVVDYRATRFEDVARAIDVVLDTVGGETLDRSWQVLAPGGVLVTTVSQSDPKTEPRNRAAFMLVEASGPQLADLARLIDAGRIRVLVAAEFPLAQAREAYARATRGGARGKIALRVAP